MDWSKHNFGTEAFVNVFRTALEAHKAAGMVMDFALGPNQGQGVPARVDDEGLQCVAELFPVDYMGGS